MRLDQYLVAQNYFESRNKASQAIKNDEFSVDGKIINKPSFNVENNSVVVRVKESIIYVARSAQKLLHGFKVFSPDWSGKVVADFGASTGGFCQVLLEHGVSKVYAVDIGTAQLHPSLQEEPRIINREHTNARYLQANDFSEPIYAITADLSFISIKAVLPAIYDTLAQNGEAIVLVKPQFEAGKKALNKNGVVSDLKIHRLVLKDVALYAENLGLCVKGISFSGLAGESGNREYLLYLKKSADLSIMIPNAVELAVFSEETNE